MAAVMRRLALAAVLWLPWAAAPQAPDRVTDVQVKAAYLYKFGAFVEWPAQAFATPEAPFVIGVAGAQAVAAELESVVAGRSIHGRSVSVRQVRRDDALTGLHVLFVGQGQGALLERLLASARPVAVLVVTEAMDDVPEGSAINLVPIDNRLRFDIAPRAAERAQLRISARLLAVARRVVPG
jgi:hypothetical protein